MKRVSLVCAVLLLLCGCRAVPAQQDVFYVEDAPAFAAAEPAYSITFAVPSNAVLSASESTGRRQAYEAEDGSYTILTTVYPDADPAAAILAETGFSAEALRPVTAEKLGMSEYRYCWTSEGEPGALVCSGALFSDGACCYCLQFRTPEHTAKTCREVCRQVLDSFSLYEDEGF